jgi:hypothetical protein
MALRILRFCRNCLITEKAVSGQLCGACGGEFLPLPDENGAISSALLVARGSLLQQRIS